MIDYRADVTIQLPIQEVFEFTTDPGNLPKWTEMEAPKSVSPGPRRVGTKIEQSLRMGARKLDMTWEITEWEPGRKYGYHATGAMAWQGGIEFTPVGDTATRVTAFGELRLKGLMRLMEPFMAGEVRRGEAAELERLKQVLEQPHM